MARQIMIIGNGAIGEGVAELANASDMVVRFNLCSSYSDKDQRCDVIALCNTGRPGKAMAQSLEWRAHPAFRSAREIWSVRDGWKFQEMKPEVLARYPELDDFFEDFADEFAAIAKTEGKEHQVLSRDLHEALDAEIAQLTDEPYVCPSSGLVAIAQILNTIKQAGDRVLIAGFTHQGWALHPFDAEKRLIDGWVAKGDLTRV
jgi:hypothetical protein